MKELDPPPMTNYVDGSTIDAIRKARKDPASLVKKAPKNDGTTVEQKAENLAKNKKRIDKMKQMYKMFLKMEKGDDAADDDESDSESD